MSRQDPKRGSLESLDTALALAWWAYETAGLILHVNGAEVFLAAQRMARLIQRHLLKHWQGHTPAQCFTGKNM